MAISKVATAVERPCGRSTRLEIGSGKSRNVGLRNRNRQTEGMSIAKEGEVTRKNGSETQGGTERVGVGTSDG